MLPLDMFRLIVDVVRAGYQTARNLPRVTCDIKDVYQARSSPDFFPDENGNTVGEGIRIETLATILLSNSGSVDTTVKDIYVICMSGRRELGQLRCRLMTKRSGYESSLSGIILLPRGIWGPKTISIEGSLWNISKPPEDLEAELVIEVVSQRPIRKKLKLYL